MRIIDENISEIEVWKLREWGIAVRQIGPEVAKASTADENILPVLHRLKKPTFFTRDGDFWNRRLAHRNYALVFLDLREREGEIAAAIRKFIRHQSFKSHTKRMGKVIRIRRESLSFWQIGLSRLQETAW